MRLVLLVLALIAFAAAQPAAPRAEDTGASADPTAVADEASEEDAERASWLKKLDEAKQRLDVAQRELDALENVKGRGASRRYPRGDAKGKYLEDLAAARTEYEDARRALPEVVEEARRAGIEPGVLDPYEQAAEAAAPAANADDSSRDDDAAADDDEEDAGDDEADAASDE
jgi:hypothetical protein